MKIDLPLFLAKQNVFPKFYFRCKKTGQERAALGSLKTYKSFPILEGKESLHTLYGAIPFSQKEPKDALWEDFSSPFFFLPKWELIQSEEETRLISHTEDKLEFLPEEFKLTKDLHLNSPKLLSSLPIQLSPPKELWDDAIEMILQKQKQHAIEKVVLARKASFAISSDIDPYLLVKRLSQLNRGSIFSLQIHPSFLFLGASPENLYQRQGEKIETEAIAGTRKRGNTPEEDALLEEELKMGIKEGKEFDFVHDFIVERLSPLCKSFSFSQEKKVIKTKTVQHLYRSFSGMLLSHVDDKAILEALHPTPAVCGTPFAPAKKMIEKLEPWDRGLYAGCIGWTSSLESSFTVSIRSALIKDHTLHAFSGAGIVEGSCPHAEWQELDQKIAHWASL
jgi:menaquinone-specific isochorismate synthase